MVNCGLLWYLPGVILLHCCYIIVKRQPSLGNPLLIVQQYQKKTQVFGDGFCTAAAQATAAAYRDVELLTQGPFHI